MKMLGAGKNTGLILMLLLVLLISGCTTAGMGSVNIPSIPDVTVGPTFTPSYTASPSASPGSSTTVSGHVYSSGAPLPGALVYVMDRLMNTVSNPVYTASDGSFVLRDVSPGYKRFFATKTGYQIIRREITVQSGDNPMGDLSASPGNSPEIACAAFYYADGSVISAPIMVYGVNFQPSAGSPVVSLDGTVIDIIGDSWGTYNIKCTWPSWALSGYLVVKAGDLSSSPYFFNPYSPDYPIGSPTPSPTYTPVPSPSATPSPTASPTPAPSPSSEPSVKQWTILFYLDGDNDLEAYALNDFNEMEQVGSSAGVNIIIQLDRSSDYRHCRRYYVTADSSTGTINSQVLQDLGNVDMGAVSSLTDFVSYGVSHYPAQRYALILWNHGSGWKHKSPRAGALKAICYDDHGTEMNISDLISAAGQIKSLLGRNVDILGFDACLMQLFEVAWGLRNYTDYIVGSEDSIPTTGWAYHRTVARLVSNPSLSPAQFANYFVDDYLSETLSEGITLSTLAMSRASSLMSALNDFTGLLIQKMSTYQSALRSIDLATQYYDYSDYSDLYDFARRVNEGIPDPQIQSAAQTLMAGITDFVIYERHSQFDVGNSHGLAIWLPGKSQYDNQKDDYASKMSFFTAASSWDEFLAALWNP